MTTLSERTRQAQDATVQEQLPRVDREKRRWDIANVGITERVIMGVAGGMITLASLRSRRPSVLGLVGGAALLARATSGYCPMYQALGIDHANADATAEDFFTRGIHVETSRTIQKPAEELFRFWRNFENLPRFMDNLESVQVIDNVKSRWKVKAPGGTTVEWDAQIINEKENELIAWRSLEGADVDNAGSVRFLPGPGGQGTEVRVVIDYIPPAGRVGFAVAKLFGREPRQQVEEDLRRFQQLMEAGEIPTTEGQPRGTCGWTRGGGKREGGGRGGRNHNGDNGG